MWVAEKKSNTKNNSNNFLRVLKGLEVKNMIAETKTQEKGCRIKLRNVPRPQNKKRKRRERDWEA